MGEGFTLCSLAPMAWEGESPSEIGSVSLSLSVSAFCDSALSPFLIYPEIRNSNWIETFATIFLQKLAFLRQNKSVNRLTGCPRGSWARPLPRGPLEHRLVLIFLPKNHKYSKKKSLSVFIPFGLRLILGFCETRNMQQTVTGTRHWINMLVPKNSIKSCLKYMKVVVYWHGTIKKL